MSWSTEKKLEKETGSLERYIAIVLKEPGHLSRIKNWLTTSPGSLCWWVSKTSELTWVDWLTVSKAKRTNLFKRSSTSNEPNHQYKSLFCQQAIGHQRLWDNNRWCHTYMHVSFCMYMVYLFGPTVHVHTVVESPEYLLCSEYSIHKERVHQTNLELSATS